MIDMNNLENLATEIGKDIKDIKTRYATKEEMHEATEIDYSQIVTHEELEAKHYLTAHQNISHLATKAEVVKKLDKIDFDLLKRDIVTHDDLAGRNYLTEHQSLEDYAKKSETPVFRFAKGDIPSGGVGATATITTADLMNPDSVKVGDIIEDYWSGATGANRGIWKVTAVNGTNVSVQGIGARFLPTPYNDTELKQRISTLESRPSSGSGGLGTEEIATYSNTVIYIPNGNIVYNKSLKKLSFPKCNVKVGKTNYWCEAQEVSINGSAGFIVFNKAQKRIVGGEVNTTNDVLLGYYDNNAGNYYINTFSKTTKTKKIACLGDSITEGVNAGGWQWHRYIDSWCKSNGINSIVMNLGIGGTSVCTSSYVTDRLKPFVNRLDTIPADADIVVIFGGTNDWGNNATLGSIIDTGTSSFYGAYKYILEWLAVNRPNAKVMTMTPLKRYFRGGGTTWVNAQTTPNNKGNLLQDYVRAVKEVSDLYAVPCVDLHNDSGLNPVLEIVRTKFMGDGLHPTAEGNKKMYPVILDKMRPFLAYD